MVEQKPSKLITLAEIRHRASKTSRLSAVSFQSLIFREQNILARIDASGHDRVAGRDREATKAGSAPNDITLQP